MFFNGGNWASADQNLEREDGDRNPQPTVWGRRYSTFEATPRFDSNYMLLGDPAPLIQKSRIWLSIICGGSLRQFPERDLVD